MQVKRAVFQCLDYISSNYVACNLIMTVITIIMNAGVLCVDCNAIHGVNANAGLISSQKRNVPIGCPQRSHWSDATIWLKLWLMLSLWLEEIGSSSSQP